MRTRRATSLVLAAAVLCAAVRASAQDLPSVSAPAARGAAPAAAAFKTPAAQKLNEQLVAHEQNVLLHLTGRKTQTFAALRQRQTELSQSLEETANLPDDERAALAAHLQKIGRLLFVTEPLARGSARLDPRLEKVLREAADASPKAPADALMQVSGQLLQAAADPQAAAAVFDNLSRRLGGAPGSKTDLAAVRVDFGAKTPLAFTPADDPRTLAGIMSLTSAPPAPKPARKPAPRPSAAPASNGGTAAAALLAAYEPFRLQLPDGAEKGFADERRRQLAGIEKLADAAERSFGGDPATLGFDALVDRLIAREGRVAANLGLGADVSDFSQIPARLDKIRQVNPQLAAFMSSIWAYRSFLNQAIANSQAALGTAFKPWEVYPDGKGSRGAVLQGYARDGVSYVALSFDMGGGASQFQGVNRDAHKALVIHVKGADVSVDQVDFDGSGKPIRTTTDRFTNRVLTDRESHDSVSGLHQIRHYAGGKLVSTETLDSKTGERHIQDLANGLDTTIGADKSVVIKARPAPPGTPPAVTLRVGAIDAHGNFALEMLETQDGQQIVVKSPDVTELRLKKEAGSDLVGWNVDVMGLVALKDPAARQKKARSLAEQTIKAVFGADDAEKVKELAGFLLDKAVLPDDADAKGGAPVRLSVNKHREFSLILAHSNGTKTILTGVFQKPPVYRDVVQGGSAFGVLHAATMGVDGKLAPYDSSVQWQYLFDGSKVQWVSSQDDPKSTEAPWYKPWQDDTIVTHFFMVRSTRGGAGWVPEPGAGWESKKDLLVQKKGSVVSRIAASKPMEIVGGALNSVSMYAHAGWDEGLGAVTGSDAIKLEARTLWNNNPANRLFIKDPESYLLGGMPPAQQAILQETALKQRMKTLAANGVTESRRPIDVRLASEAPVSGNEMLGAAANYSAGEYLGDHGHPIAGFLVSASGQAVEIVSGVAVTGGLASLGGKAVVGLIGKALPKMLPTVLKVGGVAVKAFDYGMMTAAGAMVV
ncbi:MAG TPA: hypothetical protein VH309_10785, partial [Elusimicrobiota bacterium]|nr:hypothetical protein [Elusimicrobiota bacterium]